MSRRLARVVPIVFAALLAVPAMADEPQKDPAAPVARPEQQAAKGAPGAKAKPVAKDAPATKSSAAAKGGETKAPETKPAGAPPAGAQKPPPCVEMKPCSID